jgi:hypothetical protein
MKHNDPLWDAILAYILLISGLMFGFDVSAADRNPCSEDIAKFCKDVKPGQRALMECLEEHETQLSDACKDYEARMGGARIESREALYQQMWIRQACRDDVTKFCNDVKSGSDGIATCLKEHASELSIPCRDAVKVTRGGEEEKKAK